MEVEALLILVALAFGLVPLVAGVCRVWSRVAGFGVGVLWVAASAAFGWTVARHRPQQEVADRPIEVREDGYVSSQTCRSCHPHNYATWYASYHRTMTQVATPESVVAPFDGVELDWHGQRYRLERRGDEFWVDMDDPEWTGEGDEAARVQRRIVMTTGSHQMQAYWLATGHGRKADQLPFDYNIAEQQWVPHHASFLRPPLDPCQKMTVLAPLGGWAGHCIKCHSTHGQARFGPTGVTEADTRVAEFGIACEACHGPGEEHIRVNRDPRRRYDYHLSGESDPTIVQPARLSHRRSSETCGQCHSVFYLDNARAMDWMVHGFRYRPGDVLAETRLVVQGHTDVREFDVDKATYFWSDGMVRVSGREFNGLIETPCYQRGEMSCLSCHSMHKPADDPRPLKEWADDQLKLGMDGDEACLQCHDSLRTGIEEHTHHKPGSTGSRCYNCHMPYTTYGLLKAIRSHQVDSPTIAASLETGRPNACNQCHLNRTLRWAAEYLEAWYGTPRPQMTEEEETIAASILWALRGDAGQRALMAWSMGWKPACEISGTSWMLPYLAQLMIDPYDVVRFIAYRSLRKLEMFRSLKFDYVGPVEPHKAAARRVMQIWNSMLQAAATPRGEPILVDPQGGFRADVFERLRRQRDDEPVLLNE